MSAHEFLRGWSESVESTGVFVKLAGRVDEAVRDHGEALDVLRLVVEQDESQAACPYFLRGFVGEDPDGTCDRGCVDEPSCQTDRPSEGWASERARLLLARLS